MELVWHMARAARHEEPNSLAGLDAAVASGATRVEVDVRLLADGDAALVHDRFLADGRPIGGLTCEEARRAGLAVLSDAVGRMVASDAVLQVDLKDEILLPADKAARLVELVAPLGERVVVGSMADWNLRQVRALAPDLRLGFDPLLYFHHWNDRPPEIPFPVQRSGYDYWDDHPLAIARILPIEDYVTARLGGMHAMVPGVSEVMLHYPTLLRAVGDGVDVCDFFHRRGAHVLAWTLDADVPEAKGVYERLRAAGVDVLVTNTPAGW